MSVESSSPKPDTETQSLDDVLLAMDVVDTLRHREEIVLRELDKEGREAELIERLKQIYAAQGIDVPERILQDGVKALEENRFVYKPPKNSLSIRLAKLYVSRDQWFKPLAYGAAALAVASGGWHFGVSLPQKVRAEKLEIALTETLPASLATLRKEAQEAALDNDADVLAETYYQNGISAAADRDLDRAQAAEKNLSTLIADLKTVYTVRVVYGPDEPRSGVFRIPDNSPDSRNYYLIVEAIDPTGAVVEVPVFGEEDQTYKRVTKWGVRVREEDFYAVGRDKADDQIIQNADIGVKSRGFITPVYQLETSGAGIFEW